MVAFVQSASSTAISGATVTVTLGSNTTAGNCLVIASGASGVSTNPTVTGITLGGSAGNMAQLVTVGTTTTTTAILEIWADPNCAGGQTSVVVTYSQTPPNTAAVWVYEFSGIVSSGILDKSSTAFTTSSQATWDSGATATTTQASELWFGADSGFSTTTTGPSSPWNNSTVITSGSRNLIAGYQIVSATGTADYSGTYSPNSFENAAVVTLFAAGGAAPSGQVQPRATVLVPRRRPGRVLWRGGQGQAFVAVPAPVQQYRTAPRRALARVLWRGGQGQAFVAVPAPRQQYRTPPRRTPARAYVRFTPVVTVNAAVVAGVSGTIPVLMANQTRTVVRRDGRVVRR